MLAAALQCNVFILQVVMFEDLVQRRQALDVLMSYNPFWLHIAVEVVAQKAFKPEGEPQRPAAAAVAGGIGERLSGHLRCCGLLALPADGSSSSLTHS